MVVRLKTRCGPDISGFVVSDDIVGGCAVSKSGPKLFARASRCDVVDCTVLEAASWLQKSKASSNNCLSNNILGVSRRVS